MKQIFPILFLITILFLLGCTTTPPAGNVQTAEQTTSTLGGVEGLDVGNLPPDFKITSIDGKPVHIRSLGENGKPVVVYFFATWCPHCRNDFNALNEVWDDYKDDVEIVAMSLDLNENEGKIKNYRNNYKNLESVHFSPGTQQVLSDYNVRYTTTKFAVNKDGQIIYRGSGEITPSQWRILLGELQKV